MILFDSTFLCIAFYPNAGIPNDFSTGRAIGNAKERIDGLILKSEQDGETILVPTPALSEVLVVAAPNVQQHVEELQSHMCFKIVPFGQRAAIEIALRIKDAIKNNDKREGVKSAWDKVKYDRQIVAIAKVEGASVIYSADRDIHEHGKLWGIKVLNISDLEIPAKQDELYEHQTEKESELISPEVQRSDRGRTEGQAGAEEKQAGKNPEENGAA